MIFSLILLPWITLAVTILKFGHRVSNLLAYGASDGSLSVCDVSKVQSMPQQMKGHTKDITGWIIDLSDIT